MKQEQKVSHTPTPWRNPSGSVSVFANHNQKICDLAWFNKDTQEAEANAAFIVRCVNSHQDLLDACKAVLANAEDADATCDDSGEEFSDIIALCAAIAKAEVQS